MAGIKIGYARVSSESQSLELQIAELEGMGCTEIFAEKKSGKAADSREELQNLLKYARKGDTVYVCKIDRLARSLVDLMKTLEILNDKGVEVVFIKENIDQTTAHGKMMLQMLGVIGEFERSLINERTAAGRKAAKARGVHMGRKTKGDKKAAMDLYNDRENNGMSVNEIAEETGVSRATIFRMAKLQAEEEANDRK
ncbi:recombinase family protein [Bacillus toyonensis]|uniref:recombinase family protein n=1 Tax=Bacillus toyonensis TaxID=155322 RepID=UPI000BF7AD95|nr:recombinase family protein [Bacillus toyonensis]PFY27955.1 resolvase [Bacillus toyonensis]